MESSLHLQNSTASLAITVSPSSFTTNAIAITFGLDYRTSTIGIEVVNAVVAYHHMVDLDSFVVITCIEDSTAGIAFTITVKPSVDFNGCHYCHLSLR